MSNCVCFKRSYFSFDAGLILSAFINSCKCSVENMIKLSNEPKIQFSFPVKQTSYYKKSGYCLLL